MNLNTGAVNEIQDFKSALPDIIDILRRCDQIRCQLERRGGTATDLMLLGHLLDQKVSFQANGRLIQGPLYGPGGLEALFRVHFPEMFFTIVRLKNRLPAFYLCRTHADSWAEYRLVVEEYYISPGYLMIDQRFVRLMQCDGHESYFLRLAPFRAKVLDMYSKRLDYKQASVQADRFLHRVGKNIFRAAWHEDQRLAVATADYLALPMFKYAVELIYLILGGDYSELRDMVDKNVVIFFRQVYPQPAIHAFLQMIQRLTEGDFNELSKRAIKSYQDLVRAFRTFMDAKIEPWGGAKAEVRIEEIIYGNFTRLDTIARPLKSHGRFAENALMLEAESGKIVGDLLIKNNLDPNPD
jgi:hypothetical protein